MSGPRRFLLLVIAVRRRKFRVLFAVSFVGFLVLTAVGQVDPEDEEAASCRASEGRCAGSGLLVVSPSQGLSFGGVEGVSSLFSSLGCFALLFHGEGFEGSHGVGVVAWDTSLHGPAIPAGKKKPWEPEENAKQRDRGAW